MEGYQGRDTEEGVFLVLGEHGDSCSCLKALYIVLRQRMMLMLYFSA